ATNPPPALRRDRPVSDVRFTFGKYRGCHLADIPSGYLQWAIENLDLPPALLRALRERLDIDRPEDDNDPDPAPGSPQTVLPYICWCWREAMRGKYADDPLALGVVTEGERELRKLAAPYVGKPPVRVEDAT